MKKIPQRSFVICRQKKDKSELIRIVKNKENIVSMDKTGKKEGRGAYICNNIECLEKAIKTKAFKRVLDIDVDEEIYENIRESINRG